MPVPCQRWLPWNGTWKSNTAATFPVSLNAACLPGAAVTSFIKGGYLEGDSNLLTSFFLYVGL